MDNNGNYLAINCIQNVYQKIFMIFESECIHYNIIITVNKRVVYIKDWFDAGIIFVHRLMDNNGNYLTF